MKLERLKIGSYNKKNQDMKMSEGSWENISIDDAKELVESNYEVLKMSRADEDIDFMKWDSVKVKLEEGRAIEFIRGFLRKKTSFDKCPYCGSSIISPSLSRRGNNVEICTDCGIRESFEDLSGQRGE